VGGPYAATACVFRAERHPEQTRKSRRNGLVSCFPIKFPSWCKRQVTGPGKQGGGNNLRFAHHRHLAKEIAIMDVPKTGEFAHIGKSVVIKGELSGSEDLYLDGQVEGNILLKGNNLTVGPNGQVKANVDAKGVIVQGKLEGNLHATDRVELRKSAIVTGDIATQRIAIEEGAYLKGKVDVGKDGK
jgi:cytoskeletal protein CcmA (bactofilin family)